MRAAEEHCAARASRHPAVGPAGCREARATARPGVHGPLSARLAPDGLLRRTDRADLAAARAGAAVDLQRPAEPRLRQLGDPADRLLHPPLDDADLRGVLGLGLWAARGRHR